MALKHTNNEVTEVILQNENQQIQGHIVAHSSNMKTNKNNYSGIKYGLSELSNDKTYLETELPARKRLKPEIELFNKMKNLNKTSKAAVKNDEFVNFVNEKKHSIETSCILFSKQEFKNNPPLKELLKSNLNAEINKQRELSALNSDVCNSIFQSNILADQLKWDLNKFPENNFEKNSKKCSFEPNIENNLCENIDNDKILNPRVENETEFEDEITKCCELLNIDYSRIAVVSTAETKIANDNFGNKMIKNNKMPKCEIINHNKKLDTLYPQSTKLIPGIKTISNDINLGTKYSGKKLKIKDEFLNKKVKNYEDNIEFKDESNSALHNIMSHSLTTCNENCINFNDDFFHNEINVEDNSLESEFKNNDKNNSTVKTKNNLTFNSTFVREPNIFISETIQNLDSKNNDEQLNLTIEKTLNSDKLKLKGINENIFQGRLDDKKDNHYISSAVNDFGDRLSFYVKSDINFDEREEISKTNLSESASAILEGTNENKTTVSHPDPDYDKSCIYTNNKDEKVNFIFNENIDSLDVNNSLDNKTSELNVLDSRSNNDCSKNASSKILQDIKVDESFVSEYEISLLAEDTDSILSEESLDSEYEISLLEDGIIDEENKNDSQENKSDSNDGSNYLPNSGKKDEKITAIPQRCIEEGNEQTINNVNLSKKETKKIISTNQIYSKNIIGRNDAFIEDKISSNCQNNKVYKTDFDVNISDHKKQIQTFRKIKYKEYTNEKTEQNFRAITGDKTFLKLEKPTALRYESGDIEKDLLENTDGHFSLKPELNRSQTPNKQILNSNELKNSEEKIAIVNTNNNLADGACTNTTGIEQIVETKLDGHNIRETKQNINKFKLSNEVAFNSKMNETKNSKEKVSIAETNIQYTKNTFIHKASAEKTVKTDLGVSDSSESKQDVKDTIPDYYEEEKEDLINPGWNKIKELSTDEERYLQVKDCWKSKNIPNPFKNLTYYSYRKHKMNCKENNSHQTRQHKRQASSNLNDKDAKRPRSCTYIFDNRIKSINKEKEMKTKTLHNKMFNEVNQLNELEYQEEMELHNFYGYSFEPRRQYQLRCLKNDYHQRVLSVTAEYEQKVNDCYDQYESEIIKLKNNRNEVLQFYSFYKGLNTNEYKDPTILTNAQIQELEEIENIYNQMDLHYR